jgi:two-component system chemotaxis sensor kinase CheA
MFLEIHPTDRPTDDENCETETSNSLRKAATNIIVVEAGNLRYGLIVDSLHDSEEIVVKPLGRHMTDVHFLAGATVLGDGQVALILDITGVAGHIGLTSTDQNEATDAGYASGSVVEPIPPLLFTNHPDEQFGVPMNCVSRIERIRADQIETVAGL